MNKPRGRNIRRNLTEEIRRIKALSGVRRHLNESETISARHLEDVVHEILYTDGTEEIETIINYLIDPVARYLEDAIEAYESSYGEIVLPDDDRQLRKLVSDIVSMNRDLSKHSAFRKAAVATLTHALRPWNMK